MESSEIYNIKSNKENSKKGFFNYIFNFDTENKAILSNLFQFTFIAIPLVIIILKLINHFTPEANPDSGNLVIIGEIIITITFLLFSIYFINKIIRYIPTYSNLAYSHFDETSFILPFLILLLTMETKIGEKINILVERLIDVYEGRTNLKENNNQKNKIKHKHPTHQPSQADNLPQQNSQSRNLTNQNYMNQMHNNPAPPPTQVAPPPNTVPNTIPNQQPQQNFDNMFSGPNFNLPEANEPLAANEALGGSFGSLF